MKTIKFTIIFILTAFTFNACLVEDDYSFTDNFDDGPNLVGFSRASVFASVVSDGDEKPVLVPIVLTGPDSGISGTFTGDISATVAVDPSSTAIEGVHYRLQSNSVTLSEANNYIGTLTVLVITEGIDPPLDPNPVLKLNVTNVSSDKMVVPNGRTKSISITLEYLCFSDITGYYKTNDALYYRIGVLTYDEAIWPAEMQIQYICNNTFRFYEYIGPFNGNEWYFEVDPDTGKISYPPTTPTGDPQLLNGQPLITCESNPGDMSNVPCGSATNYVNRSGSALKLYMTVGYYTGGSGPREFYQEIEKIR